MSSDKKKAPAGGKLDPAQLHELLWQALETEMGGVEIYLTALRCVQNADLRKEWTRYHRETTEHVSALQEVCRELGLDPDQDTPGRQVVRHIGKSLVQAMHMALGSDDARAAELVAAECVTLAESKDHMNWELIGEALEHGAAASAPRLKTAHAEIEDQEDEHLYHTEGWARELWIDSLGLPAVLPPPEEEHDVKTAIGAARAKENREQDME
jgi:rubrerythrin